MLSIYLFRSLRDSNSTIIDEVDQLSAAAAHDVIHARTHTRAVASTLFYALGERLGGDARRRLSLPSRGRILCRVVAVSNRRRQVVRARRERNAAAAAPRLLSCARRNAVQVVYYGRYMIMMMIILYCSRHALRHSNNYNKYCNKITIIIIFRSHNNILFGVHRIRPSEYIELNLIFYNSININILNPNGEIWILSIFITFISKFICTYVFGEIYIIWTTVIMCIRRLFVCSKRELIVITIYSVLTFTKFLFKKKSKNLY